MKGMMGIRLFHKSARSVQSVRPVRPVRPVRTVPQRSSSWRYDNLGGLGPMPMIVSRSIWNTIGSWTGNGEWNSGWNSGHDPTGNHSHGVLVARKVSSQSLSSDSDYNDDQQPPTKPTNSKQSNQSAPNLGKYAVPSRYLTDHPYNNITPHIASLVGRDLHLRNNHPIGIVRRVIQDYFDGLSRPHVTANNGGNGANNESFRNVYHEDNSNTHENLLHQITSQSNLNPHQTSNLHELKSRLHHHSLANPPLYHHYNAEDPIVTTTQCFDDLLIPVDHPGRSPSDSYYLDEGRLLRTHTSAHQSQHLRRGTARKEVEGTKETAETEETEETDLPVDAFLCSGDVYRRDEIDATHYPAFHQMEGVRLLPPELMAGAEDYSRFSGENGGNNDGMSGMSDGGMSDMSDEEWLNSVECKLVEYDLKLVLEGLMDHLFARPGAVLEKRWNVDYFPFTSPSFELEIYHKGEWMEVLGCGVIHTDVLRKTYRFNAATEKRRGWAFGLGLERLAMILFQIPDIRLFWTEDRRFHDQFDGLIGDDNGRKGKDWRNVVFQEYSKFPPVYKDIAFWTESSTSNDTSTISQKDSAFVENDFFDLVRSTAASSFPKTPDLVEKITLIDSFTHPKTQRHSKCYRITYRSMERSLTNEEVDEVQMRVREGVGKELGCEVR